MKKISIEFPGVRALSDVDFELERGSIHGLIGANGAGKSTLMKVLAGAYEHYTGAIWIDGAPAHIRSPRDAKKLGIEIVYQEVDVALVPYLSVAENIMLDVLVNEMGRRQLVNWSALRAAARKTLERLNLHIDTRQLAQDLTLAEKQMVLIARALTQDCRFLILDEPTAPLSQTETQELFRLMRDLAENHQVGIVFISHRLPELFQVCDTVTIMRDGSRVARRQIQDTTKKQVIELMLGQRFDETYPKSRVTIGAPLLEVKNLSEKEARVRDINCYVRAGEIVGIAGLVGAGKTELCKTLFGALPIGSGEILLGGKRLNIKSPSDAVKQGLALVPEERRKEGVLVQEPVYVNLSAASLGVFARALAVVNTRAERAMAKKTIKDLQIRTPNELQLLAFLSGGNQQKVAVGKWLVADAQVYIFDEPTKGVDVGAKHEIFQLLGELARKGKGILYASCETAEIMGITDRTYVMYDHTIVAELVTAATTEEEILFYSTGEK